MDNVDYYPFAGKYPFTHIKDKTTNIIQLPNIMTFVKQIEKDWFEARLKEQLIEYAIKYLQIEPLKKYIIKNFKSGLFHNPFYMLNSCIYPLKYNIKAYIDIAKILIDNYDNASELIYNLSHIYKEDINKTNELKELLFGLLPNDENNCCKYCLITEPKLDLMNICGCKTSVHVKCMLKWLKTYNKQLCEICNGIIKINDKCYGLFGLISKPMKDNRYFFPYNDLYPVPLSSSDKLVKYKGMSRLSMAVCYLQVKRVKELLKEKEILDELPNHYHGYPGYKQTLIIALCNTNIGDNYMMKLGDNKYKYYSILVALLKTKKFDINQKDDFDKTAFDYANQNYLTDYFKSALIEANIC